MDPQGTRVYPSQYIVASKQVYPFDFTIGFGNGRYGKRPLPGLSETIRLEMFQDNASWRSDGQVFGGIQFSPSKYFSLMAEYSPIAYEKQTSDPAQRKYFQSAVPSRFNFGLRIKPWDWLEADVSWQRGQQVGVNVSMAFDLGQSMLPLYDQVYKERQEMRASPLETRIATALAAMGFSNIGVRRVEDNLWIEAQNDRYYYPARAMWMVWRGLAGILREREEGQDGGDRRIEGITAVRQVHLILSENGVPMVAFTTRREDLTALQEERFTVSEFLFLSQTDTKVRKNLDVKHSHQNWWNWGLKPSFQTFINDPSGFFKYRLGASGWISATPWRGGSFIFGIEGYPLNNISSSNVPASQAVRSDAWLYKKEKLNLGMLLYEQIEKFPGEIYGRLAGGLLEVQYGGIDGEIAKPLFDGRLMVGIGGSLVKKRAVDRLLEFKQNDWQDTYKTAFFNTRLNIPEAEATIDLKTGRFLAGDVGTRVTVSKSFRNGIMLSAWWSFTNTSLFSDKDNRDYHDKGVAISIPLRTFKGTDSRTAYSFGFSPWTRDVAQDVEHFTGLFDYIGRSTKRFLQKDAADPENHRSAF